MRRLNESKMVAKARELATKAHKGQTRWGGEPFIVHPAGVVKRLRKKEIVDRGTYRYPGSLHRDEDVVYTKELKEPFYIVGWLHDVVEDTKITLGDLLDEGFSYDIIRSVDAITKRNDEGYVDYIIRVKEDFTARQVKISDIGHNLESFNQKKSKSRADKYKLALELLR